MPKRCYPFHRHVQPPSKNYTLLIFQHEDLWDLIALFFTRQDLKTSKSVCRFFRAHAQQRHLSIPRLPLASHLAKVRSLRVCEWQEAAFMRVISQLGQLRTLELMVMFGHIISNCAELLPSTLEHIYLGSYVTVYEAVDDWWLGQLGRLPRVKTLYIQSGTYDVSGETLPERFYPTLTTLVLNTQGRCSEAGVRRVAQCHKLNTLFLGVTSQALNVVSLQHLPLTYLHLDFTRRYFQDDHAAPLTAPHHMFCASLRVLELRHASSIPWKILNECCPALETLRLWGGSVSLGMGAAFPKLTRLSIVGTRILDRDSIFTVQLSLPSVLELVVADQPTQSKEEQERYVNLVGWLVPRLRRLRTLSTNLHLTTHTLKCIWTRGIHNKPYEDLHNSRNSVRFPPLPG